MFLVSERSEMRSVSLLKFIVDPTYMVVEFCNMLRTLHL